MGDHLYQYDYHFDFDDNINVILNGNACSAPTSLVRHCDHQYQPPVPFQPVAPRSPASSTTTSSSPVVDAFCAPPAQENSQLFNQSKGLFSGDPVNVSSSDEFVSDNVRVRGGTVSCSVLGVTENVTPNDHECESEEVVETLADEGPPKANRPAPRSSKRSRAAEVHNLSEKRRRSRINEKMKALQNLIPNSNKTDKASMLDEAIEYLKQLQLQVQMLTLRNGFTFNSMGVPEPLSPVQLAEMRMAVYLETGSTDVDSTGAHALALNQETPSQKVFSLPNQYCAPNQLETTKMSNTVNSETSLLLDSSVQAHFRLFQPCTAYREMFKGDMPQNLQLNPSETNPSDIVMCPFNPQAFALKDSAFETCLIGRDQEDVRLKNNLLLSPHFTGMQTGSRVPGDNFNLERSFEVCQTLVLN